MPATEESVVYFFADRIQNSDVCIHVFSCAVGLYSMQAGVKSTVDFCEEIGCRYIVGIHDHYYVIRFVGSDVHCQRKGFGFGTIGIVGYLQTDGECL